MTCPRQPWRLLEPDLPAVVRAFSLLGHFRSAAPHGSGHINDTFVVVLDQAVRPDHDINLPVRQAGDHVESDEAAPRHLQHAAGERDDDPAAGDLGRRARVGQAQRQAGLAARGHLRLVGVRLRAALGREDRATVEREVQRAVLAARGLRRACRLVPIVTCGMAPRSGGALLSPHP